MRISKKLSVKEVCGAVSPRITKLADNDGVIADGQVVELCTIVGNASSWQAKETDIGTSILLKGAFEGTSLVPNKEGKFNKVRAGQCYLPGSAAEMVSGLFKKDTLGIEFAFKISARTDSTAVKGYVYDVDSMLEPQEDDSLSRLTAMLPKALPPAGAPETGSAEVKKPEPLAGAETGSKPVGHVEKAAQELAAENQAATKAAMNKPAATGAKRK